MEGQSPSPPAAHAAPPLPGPGATWEEWHNWRHLRRDYVRQQVYGGYWHGGWGNRGWGSWFWPLALVGFGGYWLLVNLGAWPTWLEGNVFWPVLLILLGVWMLASRAWPRGKQG